MPRISHLSLTGLSTRTQKALKKMITTPENHTQSAESNPAIFTLRTSGMTKTNHTLGTPRSIP
jgi:hypothetical protein